MKVLVDTSVWSQALRRQPVVDLALVRHLTDLIADLRVAMIGPIRQELLTGISDERRFRQLADKLRAYDDVPLATADFERAAELSNQCRRRGVQGSVTDFLICSVAVGKGFEIWTDDGDFVHYAQHIPVRLHRVDS